MGRWAGANLLVPPAVSRPQVPAGGAGGMAPRRTAPLGAPAAQRAAAALTVHHARARVSVVSLDEVSLVSLSHYGCLLEHSNNIQLH